MKVLKFGSAWCQPCKVIKGWWQDIQDEMPDIQFVEYDADVDANYMVHYDIKSLPTIVIVDDKIGTEVSRYVGITTKEKLMEMINNVR